RCTVSFFDGAAVDPLVSAPDPAYSRLDPGRGSGAQATRPGRMPVTMVSHTRAPQDELSRTTSHYELEITTAPSTSPCSASRSRWEATFGFPSMVTRAIMAVSLPGLAAPATHRIPTADNVSETAVADGGLGVSGSRDFFRERRA